MFHSAKIRKTILLLASLALLVTVGVGTTLAFLIDTTDPVKNEFIPSAVTVQIDETFDGNTKSDVSVKNTGDTTAYIRAAVIVTWQNEDGIICSKAPVAGDDYIVEYDLNNGWERGSDGFYYWTEPVLSDNENSDNCSTGVLIKKCEPVSDKVPEGYKLNVEIIASGIQSEPDDVVTDVWNSGVVQVDDDTLLIKAAEGGEGA